MGQNYSLLDTAIRRYTGYNVTTEYRFHPSREWLFDFAIPEVKVGIEVEGGIWNGGRHFRNVGWLKDLEKYSEAAACGWLVVRTSPSELLSVKTLSLIVRAINSHKQINN